LLEVFYLHAATELESPESYVNQGDGSRYGNVVAMYESMSDRYTNYFTPEEAARVWQAITSSGDGDALVGMEIKVQISENSDTLVINRVYKDFPAEKAGLRKNDKILAVNGVNITGKNILERYRELAKGDEGTLLTFVIQRGTAEHSISVRKVVKPPPTVFLDSVESVPVIQITQFTEETAIPGGTQVEFEKILKEIAGAQAGIIDLRGNPGGSVSHCLAMADELVSQGELIRQVEHRYREALKKPVIDTIRYMTTPGGLGAEAQWVFLADRRSASCAEIMLAAVKQNRKILQVGDTTFGKAIGQYYRYTPAKGISAITAMQFFDQNWESYQGIGIAPDKLILDPVEALAYAVKYIIAPEGTLAKRTSADDLTPKIRALSQQMAERIPAPAPDDFRGGAWKWVD
jgi:C-terminal peptidase prc